MIQNKCKTTLVLGRKGAKVLRMKISEMITDRYKLRIPPTVYYDLLADVQEAEEEQEPTTKNDLGVDCISRDSAIKALDYDIKCFEFKRGVNRHMDDIAKLLNTIYETQVNNIKALPSTPQEPKIVPIAEIKYDEDKLKELVNKAQEPILDKLNKMKSEIADSLEFWDYSPSNNPLARDILETITNFWGDMRGEEE